MPKINNLTVVVAYDVATEGTRVKLHDYLMDTLGATQRTESVYEFVYAPPPAYVRILRRIRSIINPGIGDKAYIWDIEEGDLRRVAVHKMKTLT